MYTNLHVCLCVHSVCVFTQYTDVSIGHSITQGHALGVVFLACVSAFIVRAFTVRVNVRSRMFECVS